MVILRHVAVPAETLRVVARLGVLAEPGATLTYILVVAPCALPLAVGLAGHGVRAPMGHFFPPLPLFHRLSSSDAELHI